MKIHYQSVSMAVLLLFAWFEAPYPAAAQYPDFFRNAMQAGTSTKWQEINWQPSVEQAKPLAAATGKPILVVMHNNAGGDVNSREC
jgi:hypothetical protein